MLYGKHFRIIIFYNSRRGLIQQQRIDKKNQPTKTDHPPSRQLEFSKISSNNFLNNESIDLMGSRSYCSDLVFHDFFYSRKSTGKVRGQYFFSWQIGWSIQNVYWPSRRIFSKTVRLLLSSGFSYWQHIALAIQYDHNSKNWISREANYLNSQVPTHESVIETFFFFSVISNKYQARNRHEEYQYVYAIPNNRNHSNYLLVILFLNLHNNRDYLIIKIIY